MTKKARTTVSDADEATCRSCGILVDVRGDYEWDSSVDECDQCRVMTLESQLAEARKEIEDNDVEFMTVHRKALLEIEKQAAELAELRAMIAPFGDGLTEARWMDEFDAMTACREYNRKRKVTNG